jgi:hypothetical protein
MLCLTGCATGGSETRAPCPPVVEYTAADQARAADEVEALPEGAVVVRMLSDYVFSPGIWWIGSRMNRSGSDVQILQMYS